MGLELTVIDCGADRYLTVQTRLKKGPFGCGEQRRLGKKGVMWKGASKWRLNRVIQLYTMVQYHKAALQYGWCFEARSRWRKEREIWRRELAFYTLWATGLEAYVTEVSAVKPQQLTESIELESQRKSKTGHRPWDLESTLLGRSDAGMEESIVARQPPWSVRIDYIHGATSEAAQPWAFQSISRQVFIVRSYRSYAPDKWWWAIGLLYPHWKHIQELPVMRRIDKFSSSWSLAIDN